MKYILPIIILALVGCTTVPVKREFPEVPKELKISCPDLQLIDPDEKKLSVVVSIVADNYSKYHECKIKVDLWLEWYNNQKKVFESVK